MSAVAEKPNAVETIFREVKKLSPPEVKELGRLLFDLEIEQHAWKPESEEELVHQIINWGPSELLERYFELHRKRRENAISDEEYQELLGLIDKVGMFKADRLRRLIELAKLRNTTLNELVSQPEFAPREL
jgi:hypothetical protein